MTTLLEAKRLQVAELCRRHRVQRLEAFGSATGERFDPGSSDVDFLVEFLPLEPGSRADAYFDLLEGLQSLFGRPVDLVMTRAVTNRYFLEAIAPQREVVYAD
jgi:uncharacterized protein